jgi:hypothetical protein
MGITAAAADRERWDWRQLRRKEKIEKIMGLFLYNPSAYHCLRSSFLGWGGGGVENLKGIDCTYSVLIIVLTFFNLCN